MKLAFADRAVAWGAFALFAIGCPAGQSTPNDPATDARVLDLDALPSDQPVAKADLEAADAATPDASVVQGKTLQLKDGQTIVGELIATYDHSLWWDDPSEEQTYAVFDASLLAPYPEDQCLQFVNSTDVLSMTETALEGASSYRDVLRFQQIVIARSPLEVPSHVITAHASYHLEENGYGDFAWDFVLTDDTGNRLSGSGEQNSDYRVWDATILAPVAGTVVEVERSHPDNIPGAYTPGAPNNMVGIHLYGSYYLYLLHFRQDTIPPEISKGAMVKVGDYLGRVGNAGVSLEPHLHMTLLWYDAVAERSWSVPAEFRELYVSSSPTGPASLVPLSDPAAGLWIASDPF